MSFSKNDLKWLTQRNAVFANGAYFFDIPPMNIKVCDWEGHGKSGEKFLCQISAKGTTMYAEGGGGHMKTAIRLAIASFMLQARVVAPVAKWESVDDAFKGRKTIMTQPVDGLYSVREAARITGYSEYYVRLQIEKSHIRYAQDGTTARGGGRKYRAADLRKALGARFRPNGEKGEPDTRCPKCGVLADGFGRTHGLCTECWCRILNKYLIGQHMHLEDAVKAAEAELASEAEHTA